jgi:hypothetical protein
MTSRHALPSSRIPECIFLGVLALAAGCGGSKSEPETAKKSSDGGSATTAVETREWLFEPSPAPPADSIRAFQARLDPALGGWTGEVLVERATPLLRELLDLVILAPATGGDRLGAILATELRATPLVPEKLETRFDDGRTKVLLAEPAGSPGAAAVLEPAAVQEYVHALSAKLAGCTDARVDFDVTAVRESTPQSAELDLTIHARGTRGAEELQLNLEWTVGLGLADAAAAPRVSAIAVRRYEEVHAAGPYFADLTKAVFGRTEAFERELLLGADDYFKNVDRHAPVDFLGGYGLALGDVDGDGLDDVYVCQQSGLPNRLFVHQADGKVVDATASSRCGWLDRSLSALFLDIDNDGDQDLVVALSAHIAIGINDGKGGFASWGKLEGTGEEEIFSLSAADPDMDGDLDLYACRYVAAGLMGGVPTPYFDANGGATNFYWRNEGDGNFTNATDEVGLGFNNNKYSLASIWEDFDRDGDPDLYVTNDFGRNTYYRNDRGYFREIATEIGADDMAASMGVTCSDVDLDGDVDVYVSNMYSPEGLRVTGEAPFRTLQPPELVANFRRHARGNTLLLARGDGTFEDASERSGANAAGWAWGGMFADFQNDGLEDLYVPNGFITSRAEKPDVSSFYWREVLSLSPATDRPREEYTNAWHAIEHMTMQQGYGWAANERNSSFLNMGGARFADVSSVSGADPLDDARAVSVGDWDADGKLDLIVKNRTAPRLRFFHNRDAGASHWMELSLVGTRCNRDAIGAEVIVELEGRTLRKTLYAASGYLAQSSKRLHFGLGKDARAKSVTVAWPGGGKSRFEDVAGDALWRVTQGAPAPEPISRSKQAMASLPADAFPRPSRAVHHIVLVGRLPLNEIVVPSYTNADRKVTDLAGAPQLLVLWSQGSEPSVRILQQLSKGKDALAKAGVRVVPLCVDDASAQESARARLRELGLEENAGPADQNLLQVLDLLVIEIRGNRMGVPLPAGMLLDATGQLVVLYHGGIDLDEFSRDLRMVLQTPSGKLSNAPMMGGQWLEHPRRDWTEFASQFASLGRTELAAFYTTFASR